jgi:hypothetical protein
MRHANEKSLVVDKIQHRIELDLAQVINRGNDQFRAGLLAHQLPWNDIGVVFEVSDDNFVTGLQARAAKALGNQVDGFGCTAGEYNFISGIGVNEIDYLVTCSFVRFGGTMAQRVYAPMNVGMVLALVPGYRIDN